MDLWFPFNYRDGIDHATPAITGGLTPSSVPVYEHATGEEVE
jgi:hypothetical protein